MPSELWDKQYLKESEYNDHLEFIRYQKEEAPVVAKWHGKWKELIAWAIHRNSPRADRSFVVVDCAALAGTLVESILFGYEKSAAIAWKVARESGL